MTTLLAAPAWWDLATAAGRFTLCPVKPDRDLGLVHRWMNDPAVARFWGLDGCIERTADHLAEQRILPHTEPYLARLAGRPIGYWELYRPAEDRPAAHYPARPDDLGIRLLIGEPDVRGLGLGPLLLTALCDAIQAQSPCRIVAEPAEHDTVAVRAFTTAGFVPYGAVPSRAIPPQSAHSRTVHLPGRRTTLLIRDPDRRSDHGGPLP
jgi:acetyl CoA:N6-hydroxylysine acetyl transferase